MQTACWKSLHLYTGLQGGSLVKPAHPTHPHPLHAGCMQCMLDPSSFATLFPMLRGGESIASSLMMPKGWGSAHMARPTKVGGRSRPHLIYFFFYFISIKKC
uniref:Uncharacterized protein n=1 Tax=Morchella brunnea TaxID=1174671 RepID=A0A8K1MID0_9PEZI|nr:hypothetical protein LK370_mgp249 [Morchella brunnea]UBU98342.1 hypothetical protein [Morchella brunnea]